MLYTMSSFLPDFLPSLWESTKSDPEYVRKGEPVKDDNVIGFRKRGQRLGMVWYPSLFGRNVLRIRFPVTEK